MFYISSCTVQYYFVLSTTAHVRLSHVNKRGSQSSILVKKSKHAVPMIKLTTKPIKTKLCKTDDKPWLITLAVIGWTAIVMTMMTTMLKVTEWSWSQTRHRRRGSCHTTLSSLNMTATSHNTASATVSVWRVQCTALVRITAAAAAAAAAGGGGGYRTLSAPNSHPMFTGRRSGTASALNPDITSV